MSGISGAYKTYTNLKEEEILNLKKRLNLMVWARVLWTLLCGIGIYISWVSLFTAAIFILFIAVFLFLVKHNEGLKVALKIAQLEKERAEREIEYLNSRDVSHFDEGQEFIDSGHSFTYDLDVFGKKSLFQWLNRTSTVGGKFSLANACRNLNASNNAENAILSQELASQWELSFKFYAYGKAINTEDNELEKLESAIKESEPQVNMLLNLCRFFMPLVSLTALVLISMEQITAIQFLLMCAVALIPISLVLKKTNHNMKKLEEVEKIVSKYASLIAIAEEMEWSTKSDKLSSSAFKSLLSVIHTFNNRNNPVAGLIFNVFAAYDLHAHYKLHKWKTKHADKMVANILAIYRLDMLLSLSNVRANHPEFNYANFTDGYFEAENLYHPLLDSKVAVKNNVSLTSEGQMLIVTGPNMAGKSTLQRSVGVAVILANMGCPLPASRLNLRKLDLYTSMRASDDLSENESYFFSELKRLKFILDGARKDTSCMVLLDEILRGTNSKDKAEGSAKYIQKLSSTKAFGLVATHDLSLTKMANEIPKFENWYFDAKIEGAEIYFDYKLRPGVCQNMNATFLMKNMDLV